MKNLYFPDEEIQAGDLRFLCYMTERVARKLHQKNRYVINKIGKDAIRHLLSVANVLHAQNPLSVEEEWIQDYGLREGTFHISNVDPELAPRIPTPLQIGKVYQRLIQDTAPPGETYADGIFRIYNDKICETIDNYNCGAYFEPSYVIARAYYAHGF